MAQKGRDARVIPLAEERKKARRVTPTEVAESARRTGRAAKAVKAAQPRSRKAAAVPEVPEVPKWRGAPDLSAPGLLGDQGFAKWLQFARRRLAGEYEVDLYGYDPEIAEEILLPLLRPLYKDYWRVEVKGIDNVPAEGPALLAINHSGVVPWDGVMILMAMREEHPARPTVRLLGADLLWGVPFISHLARKGGNTVACDEDALKMLQDDEIVGVFPEGFKGIGKPFKERYRLQRFGRGGFVEVALKTGAPIIPVGIVGAEEIYPMLWNARPLARLLGLPYFPITPFFPLLGALGLLPLPSKWIVEFGEPIPTEHYGPEAAADPMTLFNIADGVRDTIQQTLYRNLLERRTWFW